MSSVFDRLKSFSKNNPDHEREIAKLVVKPTKFNVAAGVETSAEATVYGNIDQDDLDYSNEANSLTENPIGIELILRERDDLFSQVEAYRACADKNFTSFFEELKSSLTSTTYSMSYIRFNLEWFRALQFSDEAKVVIAKYLLEYGSSISFDRSKAPTLWLALAENDGDTKRNVRYRP